MKTRLVSALAFIVLALCGCATDQPRPSSMLSDGAFYQEIGKQLPSVLTPDCPVQ